MEFHEAANLFPMLTGDEFKALRDDIAANGLIEPIVLYQGKVLDGRNRYAACLDIGIEPDYTEHTGNNPVGFVLSKNLHRRHLNETQRAVVASKIANMERGDYHGNQYDEVSANLPTPKVSQSEAAKMVNVSERSLRSVKAIEREAPELLPKMAAGEMTVNEAQRILNRQERVERIQDLSANNQELVTDRQYPVIYADPPWKYEHSISESREIENQYPTMETEEICLLPVSDIVLDDCILFLWATNPKLTEAIRVIEAWGFNYRTNMVWVKDKIGMGYYARQKHELLLIATRGELPTPEPTNRPPSVIESPRTEHSSKPEVVYEIIEKMYPEYQKLEMFARSSRAGWDAWGNQI